MWTDRLLKLFVISLIATSADSRVPIRAADPPKVSPTAAGAAKKPAASTAAPAKASRTAAGAAPKPAAAAAARPLMAEEVWGHDYARAWQQSKKLKRPVLMHFHTTWCGPCRQMERDVLNSAKVLRELDARCIAVKVDCDKQPELTRQFGVEGLPCDILVTVDGKMHRLTHGFVPADEYSSMISKFGKARSATSIDLSSN